MSARSHDVIVGDAGAAGDCVAAELVEAGITDFLILDRPVISSVFDDDTDTWRLTVGGGETRHGRVVISCQPPFIPWVPNIVGCTTFRGISGHAAALGPDFDATAKRIAVIGADATAGRFIGGLIGSAVSIKVFPVPPRRVVPDVRRFVAYAQRWRRRLASAQLVTSAIETVTASGIRTGDGTHHYVDVIVYGTGFAIPAQFPDGKLVGAGGLTIQQAWHDGMEPYLGGTVHGFPNYFMVGGPHLEAEVRYVMECLRLMKRAAGTRIEVRHSSQQLFNELVHVHRRTDRVVASAYDLSPPGAVHDDAYDGAAMLSLAGTCRQVRVQLAGHIDPIDGQYHWQGTIFDPLEAPLVNRAPTVTLAVGNRSAPARITEHTSQGRFSVAGVGAPPFSLDSAEFAVPHR